MKCDLNKGTVIHHTSFEMEQCMQNSKVPILRSYDVFRCLNCGLAFTCWRKCVRNMGYKCTARFLDGWVSLYIWYTFCSHLAMVEQMNIILIAKFCHKVTTCHRQASNDLNMHVTEQIYVTALLSCDKQYAFPTQFFRLFSK